MTNQITASAEFELEAYHPPAAAAGTEKRTLSLSLGFAPDAPEPPDVPTPAEGEAAFLEFLTNVKDVRFFAYRLPATIDETPGVSLDLTRAVEVAVESGPWEPPSGMPGQLTQWLKERSGGNWVAKVPTEETEVEHTEVAAPHLLDSVANWDAPIPQLAGLVRLVRISAPVLATKTLVLVPWFDAGTEPSDSLPARFVTKVGDAIDLTAQIGVIGALTGVTVRARTLIEPAADQSSLIDDANGYLKLRPRSRETAEALKRLRERGPSELWTFPQLLALDEELQKLETAAAPGPTEIRRAIWLGVNGLLTLFDPIFLGLTMAGTTREGPFVAALIAVLESLNEELNDAPRPCGRFQTDQIAKFVTESVMAKMDLDAGGKPGARSRTLAVAFDLGDLVPLDKLNEQTELLPVLLSLYANAATPDDLALGKFNATAAWERLGNSFDKQVLVELGLLAKLAQDENEVEAAAWRVLEHIGVDENWLRAKLENSKADDAEQRSRDALAAFRALLRDSFNGLDAVRHAQGSLLEAAATTGANDLASAEPAYEGWDDADLETALLSSNWFAARLHLGTVKSASGDNRVRFADIIGKLPFVHLDYLEDAIQKKLHVPTWTSGDTGGLLDKALARVNDDLFPNLAATRFLPDSAPRDIPVQIAVDADTSDGDAFQTRFNGVALLVRRGTDQENETWRYANLAEMIHAGGTLAPEIIHPLQPVAVDGQRNLFVNYAGVPLASRDFDESFHPDGDSPETQEALGQFYRLDDPRLPAERRLPALAYGKSYRVAAHVVTKAGALPEGMQSRPDVPWLPAAALNAKTPPAYYQEIDYLRTTAIGRVTMTEAPAGGASPRIGAGIDDVVPLAHDYPRLSVSASPQPGMRDILRNADGTGSITLQDKAPFDLNIPDLWWIGTAGTLTIEVLNQPNAMPGDHGAATATFKVPAAFAGGSIAFRITVQNKKRSFWFGFSQGADAADKLEKFPTDFDTQPGDGLGGTSPAWLRLRLTGADAAISFSDPTGEVRTDDTASRPDSGSLLVIAPPETGVWRPELQKPVDAVLRYPQMGFLDFDRWFSNADARAIAFPENGKPGWKPAAARATEFHNLAMTAYLGRLHDQKLAALIDGMPDLAVAGLRLTLSPVDGLDAVPSTFVKSHLPQSKDLLFDALGDRPELAELGKPIADADTTRTHRILKALAMSSQAKVRVTSDPKYKLSLNVNSTMRSVTINVPPGVVARLTVRAMVPEAFFGEGKAPLKLIDPGIRQLAADHVGGNYLFEGPSLTIEAMASNLAQLHNAGWVALSEKQVVPSYMGAARSYDLISQTPVNDEGAAWHWRKLASIDIQTQRWRFTGRPIYNWFDPKAGTTGTGPVRPIKNDAAGLKAFEREAFFDRDTEDADIQRKRLDPAPAVTVLQAFPWNLPSATLFRHRVTLRSRYAGALLRSGDSSRKGYAPDQWLRVAMLADRARLQLTRPQLRALMPLTISPTQDGAEAAAPPVMAILDERPFAHGGLADRIGAEIRTGFGFGFVPEQTDVRIFDSRKEVGPDPRLSYDATLEEIALALTIESEGPIGLTFDDPTAPAPAFASTALLLQPRLAQRANAEAGSLEEHFLSVAMRRYLDHRWLTDDGRSSTASVTEPAWIEFDKATKFSAGTLDVLRIERKDDQWQAWVRPLAIDPKGPEAAPDVQLATAGIDYAGGLAILHLPLEEGRASLTLFALPGERVATSEKSASDVAAGQGDAPVVLASFEWHVPTGVEHLAFGGGAAVHPTSASPATHMNWTRTGKTFDVIETRDAAGQPIRLNSADLEVVEGASKAASLARRGAVGALHLHSYLEGNPLFVHRHVAVVSTKLARGIGRTVEVYGDAWRVMGSELGIAYDKETLANLRVVTFETLARPISAGVEGMKDAEFDLLAVIGDKYLGSSKPPVGLSFAFRPIGSAVDRSMTEVNFTVMINGQQAAFTASIEPKKAKPLCWVHFSVVQAGNGSSEISGLCVFDDGTTQLIAPTKAKFSIAGAMDAETVRVTAGQFKGSTGEHWGDVSMLTVQPGDTPRSFSWNWLFTGRGDLEAAEAVTPARLLRIPEAEARIIAVSPPIPLGR